MWRYTGCATSSFYSIEPFSGNNNPEHKLYLKFNILPNEIGYQVLLTDFKGNLWRETLIGQDLQDRLKSETTGLEIDTKDLINLLEQMCQNIIESSCENSSDFKNLILKTSVKIGFIKLKWTFKTESCGGFAEMINQDFLLPFFANLRDDKLIKDDFNEEDLTNFYEILIPKVKRSEPIRFEPIKSEPIKCEETQLIIESPQPSLNENPNDGVYSRPPVDVEEMKRKALEEQLQASKKKKKKLI